MKKIFCSILTGLTFLISIDSALSQQPLPCPAPLLVNYSLAATPSNTISAGTTVLFKVVNSGNGSPINDMCLKAEWYVNGAWVYGHSLGDGVSTTSYGYSSNLLLDKDVVSCNVFQLCGCTAELSTVDNSITMNVSGVLSVELVNFSGNTEGGINHLFWSTATEIKNKGFQIERLNSTAKTWEILGFVPAQGKAASYEFTDKYPLSIGYYRLRQLDIDGKEQLSNIISLLITNKKVLAVYPNPTAQVLNIDVGSNLEKDKTLFQIFNILGQSVQSGILAKTIDVSTLALGTYILKIGTEQIKFHKQ